MPKPKHLRWGARPVAEAELMHAAARPVSGNGCDYLLRNVLDVAAQHSLLTLVSLCERVGGTGGSPGDVPVVHGFEHEGHHTMVEQGFYGQTGALLVLFQDRASMGQQFIVRPRAVRVQLTGCAGTVEAIRLEDGEPVLVTRGAHGLVQVQSVDVRPVVLVAYR